MKKRILFVCMGNICRSPSAEGVLRHVAELAKVDHLLEIDSAGTHAYHIGEQADSRSMSVALSRDIDLSAQRARAVVKQDFELFDLILVMDNENLNNLRARCPAEYQHKLHLFLQLAEQSEQEVPDPYYGGANGFEHVLDLLESASGVFVEKIRKGEIA